MYDETNYVEIILNWFGVSLICIKKSGFLILGIGELFHNKNAGIGQLCITVLVPAVLLTALVLYPFSDITQCLWGDAKVTGYVFQ